MSSAGRTDRETPEGGRFDQAGDATRRTHLANERTYLAWWRSGLASMAGSLGTGRLVPALTSGNHVLYTISGIGFALLGVAFFLYGWQRYRAVDRAIARGEYVRPDERLLATLAGVGIALALIVLVIVLVDA
jgi:putative membrane protein